MGSRELRDLIEGAVPNANPGTVAYLVESVRQARVSKGETVYWQGELVPLTMMLVGYGAFRRTTLDGQQVTVGIANPGLMFGFASIASTYTSVNLVALTE